MSEAANREEDARKVVEALQEEERLHDERVPQRQLLGSMFRQLFSGQRGRAPA